MPIPPADVELTHAQVRRLLAAQHPDLARLPLVRVATGWDNVMYRLGADWAVRLPRRRSAVALLHHEVAHLPRLAPHLPVPVPAVVRTGQPGAGYPYPWVITRWFRGTSAARASAAHRDGYARQLARFFAALHRPAPADAPTNAVRGTALRLRRDDARRRLADFSISPYTAEVQGWWPGAVEVLDGLFDASAAAPEHAGPLLWLHGDPHPHNTVCHPAGVLAAIIDFGDITRGDPASDLGMVWLHFTASGRRDFADEYARAAGAAPDDALWLRARGWAVHYGLIASLHPPMEPLHAVGIHALTELLLGATAG
ncbi:aminoglycoside phosphotransferase family protein [Zhihengliuella flava]|uniref:Aminoglycoside phosphotransferase (APT) family kinase protein n=1 Tax=Zhihengliuella flava TaxID=1285193 RepID=A0A931GDY1_9MICC|nr:aminoglycoside phosphotransferase family protein [Zhihengliuella flava]MBG6083898.1 aminoglycoside phosphotransferase (APT) family kinase protein [Zhihengliuella flava]